MIHFISLLDLKIRLDKLLLDFVIGICNLYFYIICIFENHEKRFCMHNDFECNFADLLIYFYLGASNVFFFFIE